MLCVCMILSIRVVNENADARVLVLAFHIKELHIQQAGYSLDKCIESRLYNERTPVVW